MKEPINLQCIRCCEHVGYEYFLAFEELSVSGNIHHQIQKSLFCLASSLRLSPFPSKIYPQTTLKV